MGFGQPPSPQASASIHPTEATDAHDQAFRPRAPQHAFAKTLKTFSTASGKKGQLFSLPALAATFPGVSRLPVSIRIVLESVLRNCDGGRSPPSTCAQLARWQPNAERSR
jgi:aconitate hydratase